MYMRKILAVLGLVVTTSAACGIDTPEDPIDLRSLAGSGRVDYVTPTEGVGSEDGRVEYVDSIHVPGEANCQGIEFSNLKEPLVGVIRCESGRAFSCVPGIERCLSSGFVPASGNRDEFRYLSDFNYNYYVVQLHSRRLVYKIQELGCLIEYPHGCLIPSLFWRDLYSFEFSLVSQDSGLR